MCLTTCASMALFGTAAVSDEKVTDAQGTKIKEAVAAWGCDGGTYEKETQGSGVLEAEDVKCNAGNYDFRLTEDFKVFAITMD